MVVGIVRVAAMSRLPQMRRHRARHDGSRSGIMGAYTMQPRI